MWASKQTAEHEEMKRLRESERKERRKEKTEAEIYVWRLKEKFPSNQLLLQKGTNVSWSFNEM